MADLKDAGVRRRIGRRSPGDDADLMRRALEYASTFDLPSIQHCEDHDARRQGARCTRRRLDARRAPRLAGVAEDDHRRARRAPGELTGARYHVAHVTTRGAVRLLREAKSARAPGHGEVTPHHLMLTDAALHAATTPRASATRRCARRRTWSRSARRSPTARSTPSRPTTRRTRRSRRTASSTQAASGMIGLETCAAARAAASSSEGVLLARRWSTRSPRRRRRSSGLPAARCARARRRTSTVVDPERRWTRCERAGSALARARTRRFRARMIGGRAR